MSKLAYLECPTGIAGDMCLGALIHAGVPLEYLIEQLNRLGISDEFWLRVESVQRNGQQATKVHVDLKPNCNSEFVPEPVDQPYTTFVHSHSATESAQAATHHHADTHTQAGHSHSGHSHGDHSHHHHSEPSQLHSSESEAAIPHPHVRHLPEIEHLIQAAHLPARAEAWSLSVFRTLAAAEGAVHGIAPEQVHFHEVGATDAIVDIVGTCLGLDWLDIDQLYCSPMPTGGGIIRAAHGRLPVPTPAVLKLWEMRQVPIYSNGIDRELVTPTGAAIAVTLATRFGPPPTMTLQKVGLGAGSRDLSIPNMVRLWLGEGEADQTAAKQHFHSGDRPSQPHQKSSEPSPPTPPSLGGTCSKSPKLGGFRGQSQELKHAPSSSSLSETVEVLETQIDDLNPQAIGYVFNTLFEAGALDVFTQAIAMKKSRPGVLLTVICHPEQVAACEELIFRETSTLGIRRSTQQRRILAREIQQIQTEYGSVRVKVAWTGPGKEGAIANVQPEYEDCAQIAQQQNLPWREIHRVALQAWYLQQKRPHQGVQLISHLTDLISESD
uniref:nickel pincer cofactor biosynthesis protein LarC n=1 Tax=Trichocoleus desertorum TaxID=1481672 RepID=UPI0025B42EB0|nr:nickel pincer cofactor biosynthesis protein LarC [Trichocoleus desertorum]